jgi:hypothetical protein
MGHGGQEAKYETSKYAPSCTHAMYISFFLCNQCVVLRGLLFLKFKYCISARNKTAKFKNKMLPEPYNGIILCIINWQS